MVGIVDFDTSKNLKVWLKSIFEKGDESPSATGAFTLKAIDLEIANSLCLNEIKRKPKQDESALKVYAYLMIKLSQALSRGEVCIELSRLYDMPQKTGVSHIDITQFETVHIIEHPNAKDPYELVINYPLVAMQGRLYFSRYWFYQQQVFHSISARLAFSPADMTVSLENSELSKILQQLFPATPGAEVNWQMLAAANACLNRFSVITGGPGTGKTTTVTRLLAALISQQPNLRIALAAPTGKAAARLVESILAAKDKLAQTFPLAEKIPLTSFTLHRLLGWRPHGFTYNHKKILPYDLVVVDEASMVDLPMMAQLMEALGENTHLILLGDKDQLASVEAGSVLGDLCDSGVVIKGYHAHGLQRERASQLEQLCGLQPDFLTAHIEPDAPLMANSLTQLRVSYRFTQDSGIGKLAAAVNAGRFDQVQQSFQQYQDIHWYTTLAASFNKENEQLTKNAEQAWQQQVINGYRHYLEAIKNSASPFSILTLFNEFQLLCGLRQGSSGLQALNERVQTLLQGQGLLHIDSSTMTQEYNRWYVGRPVMISQNDYELNLFNGDIGIAMMVEVAGQQELRVCFIAGDSEKSKEPLNTTSKLTASKLTNASVRQLLPTRLPSHETAFAMTVHKSQGSEFSDVALVLPEKHSPVISRELIYTAITRAKNSFSLYASEAVLGTGVKSRIERASGLRGLLF